MAQSAPLAATTAAIHINSPRRDAGSKSAASKSAAGHRDGSVIETDIPNRLESLPFGRFHLLVIVALGITWVLDGLKVTLAGSLSGELMQKGALGLSNAVGWRVPLLLGSLISIRSHADVAVGYFLGAVLMLVGAIVKAIWGVAAERKSLESVARPLSFVEQ